MKAFLSRLGIFSGILVLFLVAITILVPATPRTKTSLLFAKLDKDLLLHNTPSPRLILVGGSNMSMGTDSKIIKEELGKNPINTAIHASIGFEYMAKNILNYIRPGDIVLVSLEYSQFYGQNLYGGEELLRTVFDVDRSSLGSLDFRQWLSIIRFIPKYSISKINPSEYNFKEPLQIGIYERSSFNEFGDAYIHWTKPPEIIESYGRIEGLYNRNTIKLLVEFNHQISELGGKMVITYPAIQEDTFQNMHDQIMRVQSELDKSGLTVLGTPERYIVDDTLLHDTPYHLSHEGSRQRTYLLLEDLISTGVVDEE